MDITHKHIRSAVDGYVGCFQVVVTTNKAVGNIHVQLIVYTRAFTSLEQIP